MDNASLLLASGYSSCCPSPDFKQWHGKSRNVVLQLKMVKERRAKSYFCCYLNLQVKLNYFRTNTFGSPKVL